MSIPGITQCRLKYLFADLGDVVIPPHRSGVSRQHAGNLLVNRITPARPAVRPGLRRRAV